MQQFRVSYYLRSRANKDGSKAVQVRINLNGERMFLGNANVNVYDKDWDGKLERVTLRTAEGRMINNTLESLQAELIQIFRKYEFDPSLSLELIKSKYKGSIATTSAKDSFVKFFEKHVNERKEEVGSKISSSCYYKYSLTFRHFIDFLKAEYQRTDIAFCELDYTLITNFERFMRKNLPECCNNTLMRKMRVLKTIMIDARKHGLMTRDPFAGYKVHFTPTNRGFLEDDEVQRLIEHEFHCKRLEQVRDFFLFSIFTGLAYTDIKHLKKENIVELNKRQWIIKCREKTEVSSHIPLLPMAANILDKYKDECKDGHLLPIPSNQKMNSYLKEIADFCDIQKRLTCHLGRHTFATMTLSKGVPIESVSHMLGHTNIKTTQIYARITAKKIEHDMEAFASKIGGFGCAPKQADLSSDPHKDALAIDAQHPVDSSRLKETKFRGRPRKKT